MAAPDDTPRPLRLEYRSPAELAENPRNWRRHPQAQLAALTDVIGEVGWAGACLFNERTGRLIDGHARRKVALDQGAELVPVLVGDWDEAAEAKILATLDPIAGMAEADAAALDALLRDVQTGSQAVGDMLTKLAEDAGVVPKEHAPGAGGDEFDAAPEQSGPTRARPGDLWVIGGNHRLLVGDCTDPANVARLMAGGRAAMCFTSPPYNAGDSEKLTNNTHTTDTKYVVGGKDRLTSDGYRDILTRFTRVALGVCDLVVVNVQSLAGNKVALLEYLHEFRGHFADVAVWVKDTPQPAMARRVMTSAFEYLLFFSSADAPTRAVGTNDFRGTVSNVYRGPSQRENEYHEVHAATFPLHLPTWALESFGLSGEMVYDPFMGTGTTLIAAHRLGRTCYGCEIEPRYADVILKRAEAEGLAVEKAG